ncbi:hypothetical protein CJ195_20755 [Bacillus sp. UMB0899]|nr:hypothetical protein CJ195_20755 [Bacillus sp. UMB0899]
MLLYNAKMSGDLTMDTKANRSGFTLKGFSKSGFGCCGHHNVCSMGKLDCFYEHTDPEVMKYCACYQRNHNTSLQTDTKNKEENEKSLQSDSKESLYIFDSENSRLIGQSLVNSYNLRLGDQYILRPTNSNSGTHFFVNRISDNEWLGSYKVSDFKIVKGFCSEDLNENNHLHSIEKPTVEEEKPFVSMEQLSLF